MCLLCKYYLNINFLLRSNINRLLNFPDLYTCFWFFVMTAFLILGLTKCNIKLVFFVSFYFSIYVHYSLKEKKWLKIKKKIFYHHFNHLTETLCSFRLAQEGKTGKETPDASRIEFLRNNFALSDAEDSTSWPLKKEGIVDLPLLKTLLAIRQSFWETNLQEVIDCFVFSSKCKFASFKNSFA